MSSIDILPRQITCTVEETRPHPGVQYATSRTSYSATIDLSSALESIENETDLTPEERHSKAVRLVRSLSLQLEESLRNLVYEALKKDNLAIPASSRYGKTI